MWAALFSGVITALADMVRAYFARRAIARENQRAADTPINKTELIDTFNDDTF